MKLSESDYSMCIIRHSDDILCLTNNNNTGTALIEVCAKSGVYNYRGVSMQIKFNVEHIQLEVLGVHNHVHWRQGIHSVDVRGTNDYVEVQCGC